MVLLMGYVIGKGLTEAVAVVGGDEDEGVSELAEGFELCHCGFDGVVELEEVAESAVVVEGVPELFSDR